MAEYIDRIDFINKLEVINGCVDCNEKCRDCGVNDIKGMLRSIPAADVAPVVHAHNNNQTYIGADEFRCSKCGIHIDDWLKFDSDDVGFEEFEFKYCPNCGAKMDEEEQNGNV